MLGWMLKRGDDAPDVDAGDTTRVDQPDTPAPVFAARAFKSALFGTPAPPSDEPRNQQDKMTTDRATASSERASGTQPRPPGILLTPGTGTSRRKRVSFGHPVPGATKTGPRNEAAMVKDDGDKRRVRCSEAHDKSRKETAVSAQTTNARRVANDSEGEWEEEEDDYCTNDITLDLNEPHSQSGQYWKQQFEKYHQEARAEMEKLLKYKQLAKSYAQQKDSEAIQLTERLRDEQQKVIKMERKIAENASQIVSKHRRSSDEEPTALLSKLAKQTTLAAQYRHRVQELEDDLDAFLRQKEGSGDAKRRPRRPTAASPTTQKTLLEAQRELRRAQTQLKELDALREEVSSLKARVKAAEAQASRSEKDGVAASLGGSRARDLRAQLEQAREESRTKDEELRQLRSNFEAFTKESEAHEADTKAVLERAYRKISDLKKEIKARTAADLDGHGPTSRHPYSEASRRSGSGAAKADGYARNKDDPDDSLVHDRKASGVHKPQTLRDQFQVDGGDVALKSALGALARRPEPRWQPFVPRSPRNRACLGGEVKRRNRSGGATSAAIKSNDTTAARLPAVARTASRSGAGEVDLLQGRLGPLEGRGINSQRVGVNASVLVSMSGSSALPPERRAAALARIERRMAEKERARKQDPSGKENMRP